MKCLRFSSVNKTLFVLMLLFSATVVNAQWDYDYSIGMQMEQKPLGNALIQHPSSANSNLIGVHNEAGGRGFWIYETDVNGQMVNSHYYVHNGGADIVLRAYAIEHTGAENIVTGEVDYGNGQRHLFLMACNAAGNGAISSALVLVSSNINSSTGLPFNTVGIDLVQTSFGLTPEFMAICREDINTTGTLASYPNPARPYVVKFDKNLTILNTWYYTVPYPHAATQARLVNSGTELFIVGEIGFAAGSVIRNGIFLMRIDVTTGSVITTNGSTPSTHVVYGNSSTEELFSPVISSTGLSDIICFSAENPVNNGGNRLAMAHVDLINAYPASTSFPNIAPNLEYQDGIQDLVYTPIQLCENASGDVNLVYNRLFNGQFTPHMLTTNASGVVLQNTEFPDASGESFAVAGTASATNPDDVYFSTLTYVGQQGVTYTTPGTAPQCAKNHTMSSASINGYFFSPPSTTVFNTLPQVDDMSLSYAKTSGIMRDCNGNLLSSFKKNPVGLESQVGTSTVRVISHGNGLYSLNNAELKISQVLVNDINGRELFKIDHPARLINIDLNAYAKGSYLVSVQQNNTSEVVKIVR